MITIQLEIGGAGAADLAERDATGARITGLDSGKVCGADPVAGDSSGPESGRSAVGDPASGSVGPTGLGSAVSGEREIPDRHKDHVTIFLGLRHRRTSAESHATRGESLLGRCKRYN